MSRNRTILQIVLVAMVGLSCGDNTTTPPAPQPTSIQLNKTSVSLDALGATDQLTATVLDQNDQPMSGQPITFTSSSPAIATVSSNGLVTAISNGQADVTVASGGITATVNVTVAQVVTQLAKISGDGQSGQVGQPLAQPIAVEAQDRLGQAVPGGAGGAIANTTVQFSAATGGGSVNPASAPLGADGRASTTWTLGSAAGPQTLTAELLGGQLTTTFTASFGATGAAGPPATALAASGNAQTGTVATPLPSPLVVSVEDQFANPVQGVDVSFAVTMGGGSVSASSVQTDANGEASVTWTLGNVPGPNEVTFTVTGLAPGTFTATGQLGPPANVVVTAGDGQSAQVNTAVAVPPTVQVTDVGGNPLSGETVTFAVTAGGGSITGGTQTTDGSGNATVGSWTLGTTAGANELTATAGSASGVISATGTPGPAAGLAINAGDGQSAIAGTAVATPPSVLVTDAFGNAVSGESITFTVTGGGGSVTGSPATSDGAGIATVGSWVLGGTPGPNTMDATGTGLPTVTFNATGVSATPDMVVINDGNNQVGLVGAPVNIAPSVLVTSGGLPFPGATVTFAVTGGGGSVSGNVVVTDANGIAEVGDWTLGGTAGANTLDATVTGGGITGNPVSFTATGQDAAFNIEVRFLSAPTAAQQTAFNNAEAKWELLIFGDVVDQAVNIAADACGANTNPAVNETIDDLVIFARLEPIDGVGGILGSAGPCVLRSTGSANPRIPAYGIMRFDTDDLANLEAAGQLGEVIMHEMGHVLGYGTLWGASQFDLLRDPSLSGGADPHFIGARGLAEFDNIGGVNYTGGQKVPVENTGGQGTADGHWRETVFDEELMTGFLNNGVTNPLSSLSVASMWDMGYLVNMSGADAYSQTFSLRAGPSSKIQLRDDILEGPMLNVEAAGRVIAVLQR